MKKEPFLQVSKRRNKARWQERLLIRFIALILALIVCGAVIVALVKMNPVDVYKAIWDGAMGSERRLWQTIRDTMVLLCISIGLAPDYKNYRIMDHKVTFGGKPVTLVGNRCKVGETAPVFTVTDAGLQPVSSDVFHGKVRIYSVFPSVDTPVCSLQNIRFNREASKLGDDVVVVSLSVDLPFAQKRFCAAEGIDRVHVFSDYRELDFGMKYGFVIDSLRLLARGVVVVDREDVVRYVEYVPEVTHEPDYEKALAVARELAK